MKYELHAIKSVVGRGEIMTRLGDICEKIGSGATPHGGKEAYCLEGISFVRSQNIGDFSFSANGLAHINNEQAKKLSNVELKPNDILLNITGDSVARTCIIDSEYLPARVNQHVAIIRGKKDIVLSSYLLYFLQWKKKYLLQLASAGATRNALTKSMIEQLEIELPTIEQQRKIAGMLDKIQEKIKLNQKINDNLEQQAMALYRQMFVENNNDARRECRADEYFDISIGKTPPRKEAQWFSMNPTDCIWVSISDMGRCGMYIADSSEYLTHESVDKFNIKVVPDNTVLLSFKLTVGRVAITDGAMVTNEAIAHFKTDKPEINEYLYCYLKDFNYQTMGSTSSIATAVNSKIIKAMPFVIPTDAELVSFHSATAPMFEMIKTRQRENTRLAELRDSLLPKLMSGEIDVSAVQL